MVLISFLCMREKAIENRGNARRGRRWLRQRPACWLWWVTPSGGSNPFPFRHLMRIGRCIYPWTFSSNPAGVPRL